jgi:two-component sensor histidine kinase
MKVNHYLENRLIEVGVGKFRRGRLIATFWIFSFLLPFIVGFALYNFLRGEITFLPLHISLFLALGLYLLFLSLGRSNTAYYLGILPSIALSIFFLSLWVWGNPESDREFELFLPLIFLMVIQIPALIGSSGRQMILTLGISLLGMAFYVILLDRQGRANFPVISGLLSAFALSAVISLETFRSARTAEFESDKRDLLQREVHHRIKNEASMLAYLLDSDIRKAESAMVKEELEKIKSRVLAVFISHNQLYQTTETSESDLVNFRTYLLDVTRGYGLDLREPGRMINLQVEGPDIQLSQKDASYLGLVCNELLMNTLKHSREPVRGTVRLDYEGAPGQGFRLVYQDLGFAKKPSSGQKSGFGTQFIKDIVRFNKGSLNTRINQDFWAEITLPQMKIHTPAAQEKQ